MRKVTKFVSLTGREKTLFAEALILETAVGLLLKIIPFRLIPRLFASHHSAALSLQPEVPGLIKKAIRRASWVSPWRNKCLVSSLAGRWMMNRRKIKTQISLGVTKEGAGKIIAHAWLRSGDYEIVPRNGEYVELHCF